MDAEVKFGDALLAKGKFYFQGEWFDFSQVDDFYYGASTSYMNSVPMKKTYNIRVKLKSGKFVELKESKNVGSANINKDVGLMDGVEMRYGIVLKVFKKITNSEGKSIFAGVESFKEAAFRMHSRRSVDFFWLFIYLILGSAYLWAISFRINNKVSNDADLFLLLPLLAFLFLVLSKLSHLLSDRG